MTQDDVSDEMLMALADGELGDAEAAALMRRIAADPAVAARHALFVETRSAVAAALRPGPVPDRLVRAILDAPASDTAAPAQVLPFRPRRSLAVQPARWLAAVAAVALMAVGIGGFLAGRATAPGTLAAAPSAAAIGQMAALPAGAELAVGGDATMRVLASFRTDLGLCRLAALSDPAQGESRLVACRSGAGWQLALTVREGAPGGFRLASDLAVSTVDAFLDGIGAGPALGAAEEAAALAE
jgi:hypothetical protein